MEIFKSLRNKNLSEFLRTIHPYTLYTPLKLTGFDELPTFGINKSPRNGISGSPRKRGEGRCVAGLNDWQAGWMVCGASGVSNGGSNTRRDPRRDP